MIRTDIKSARSSAVIKPLQKGNEHEIAPVAKLDRADSNVNGCYCKQEKKKPHPRRRVGENASRKKIHQQASQNRINVGARQIVDRRENSSEENVTEECRRADQTDLMGLRLGSPDRDDADHGCHRQQSIGRQAKK